MTVSHISSAFCTTAGLTAVRNELQCSPYWPVRQLTCYVAQDRIVLDGIVPTYYLKQVAQSVAAKIVGNEQVQSEIQVRPG